MDSPLLAKEQVEADGASAISRLHVFVVFQLYAVLVVSLVCIYMKVTCVTPLYLLCAEASIFTYWKGSDLINLSKKSMLLRQSCEVFPKWFPVVSISFSLFATLVFSIDLIRERDPITQSKQTVVIAVSLACAITFALDKVQQCCFGRDQTQSTFLARASARCVTEAVRRKSQGIALELIGFYASFLSLVIGSALFASYCVEASIVEVKPDECSNESVFAASNEWGMAWIGSPRFVQFMWPNGAEVFTRNGRCLVMANFSVRGAFWVAVGAMVATGAVMALSYSLAVCFVRFLQATVDIKGWMKFIMQCTFNGPLLAAVGIVYLSLIPVLEYQFSLRQKGAKRSCYDLFKVSHAIPALILLDVYARVILGLVAGLLEERNLVEEPKSPI